MHCVSEFLLFHLIECLVKVQIVKILSINNWVLVTSPKCVKYNIYKNRYHFDVRNALTKYSKCTVYTRQNLMNIDFCVCRYVQPNLHRFNEFNYPKKLTCLFFTCLNILMRLNEQFFSSFKLIFFFRQKQLRFVKWAIERIAVKSKET